MSTDFHMCPFFTSFLTYVKATVPTFEFPCFSVINQLLNAVLVRFDNLARFLYFFKAHPQETNNFSPLVNFGNKHFPHSNITQENSTSFNDFLMFTRNLTYRVALIWPSNTETSLKTSLCRHCITLLFPLAVTKRLRNCN